MKNKSKYVLMLLALLSVILCTACPTKLDSGDGKKLNDLYPIRATPTLFYFTSDGTLAKKWEGVAAAPQLLLLSAEVSNKQ